MNPIKIKPTKNTPAVFLDPTSGVFKMYGRSSPENSLGFYEPIRHTLSKKMQTTAIDIRIKMEYFNTSSSKCLYDLFKEAKGLTQMGKSVSIRWYYEENDEDMMEAGEDYSDLLGLPFIFVQQTPKPKARRRVA